MQLLCDFVIVITFVLMSGSVSTVIGQGDLNLDNWTKEEMKDLLVSIMEKLRLVEETDAKAEEEVTIIKQVLEDQNSKFGILKKQLLYQEFVNRRFKRSLKTCLSHRNLETRRSNSKPESHNPEKGKIDKVTQERLFIEAGKNNDNRGNGLLQRKRSNFGKRGEPEHVAFSAYINNRPHHLGVNQIIRFQGMLLNEGGAYNSNTGVFTCPRPGVYLFSVAIGDKNVDQLIAKLVVDNALQMSVVAESLNATHVDQGANVAIVRLTKGQSVWVAVYDHVDSHIESLDNYRYATFSGVFLYT